MGTEALRSISQFTPFEQLRYAREILQAEGDALAKLAAKLPLREFCRAAEIVWQCRGSVLVTGMGKAGIIGQKLVATFASTGTRSHFLHPAEAVHGDLGKMGDDDVLVALSFRGETEEVLRLMPRVAELGIPLIAVTGHGQSSLARQSSVVLDLGPLREADRLGLAPTTSTTAMLALGDALALVVSGMRGFVPTDFARFHPGGSLGRKLAKVEDVMRPIAECRVANELCSVREVFVQLSRPGRRTGAIMLVNERGELTGIFTDSDLARLFEGKQDALLDGPIRDVMTVRPASVRVHTQLAAAVELLAARKISELPVENDAGHPCGLLDITDVLALLPADEV